MVSDCCVDSRRDRAQLILIGAITLAFIILGLVVVVNGVLVTETLAPGDSSRSGSDAAAVEHDIEQGIAGIAHRGNLEWNGGYESQLEDVIDDGYSERYRNTTANSQPAIVDVEFDAIGQDAYVKTNEPITLVDSSLNTTNVGHLAFKLEATGSGEITVEDTNQNTEITIIDAGNEFIVEDNNGNDCTVRSESASINVVSGEINVSTSTDCEFNTIDPSEESTLSITEDDDMEGTYDLVVRDNGLAGVTYDYTDRAWAVDVTVTYDSSDVSYERPYRVFLYGEGS